MAERITPSCRYGHGDLLPISEDGQPLRWFAINTDGSVAMQNRGYTFVILKCPDCSYLEFHDDEAL